MEFTTFAIATVLASGSAFLLKQKIWLLQKILAHFESDKESCYPNITQSQFFKKFFEYSHIHHVKRTTAKATYAMRFFIKSVSDKQPILLNREEMSVLLAAIPRRRSKNFVLAAVNTGLRRSEIANLKWDLVDLAHILIYLIIADSLKTKNSK